MANLQINDEGVVRWRETLDQTVRISLGLLASLWRRDVLLTLMLVVVLVISAVGVIYAAHINRQLFNELAKVQAARDEYERVWSQLLLEQGALSAHSRVESEATARFQMRVPEAADMIVIEAP